MSYPDFMDMPVYQKALDLLLKMYEIIKTYPADERYCLTSDTKRAANSIAHNIAEGFGRYEPKDKTRFYKISRGSSFELISQAIVAFGLGYIKEKYFSGHIRFGIRCYKRTYSINKIIRKQIEKVSVQELSLCLSLKWS